MMRGRQRRDGSSGDRNAGPMPRRGISGVVTSQQTRTDGDGLKIQNAKKLLLIWQYSKDPLNKLSFTRL